MSECSVDFRSRDAIAAIAKRCNAETLQFAAAHLLALLPNDRAAAVICERVCSLGIELQAVVASEPVELIERQLKAARAAETIAGENTRNMQRWLRVARGLDKREVADARG